MRQRLTPVVMILAAVAVVAAARIDSSDGPHYVDPDGLIVHEWGTFTSIAAPDGSAVNWTPRDGPEDLPCFVKRIKQCPKCGLQGTVRMETPVLYFHSARDTDVKVQVRFREGAITEWYPDAAVTVETQSWRKPNPDDGVIAWPEVKIRPAARADFPTEPNGSHYYAARATKAAPVEVGGARERFLFYRGVGRFAPPVGAKIAADGRVEMFSATGRSLGNVILFDNDNGRIRYQILERSGDRVRFGAPAAGDLQTLHGMLQKLLLEERLYADEAAAMVETWRDSWFEEGTRILYIVPRPVVDEILPLEISPSPLHVNRVFVGRLELLPPALVQKTRKAIDAGDWAQIKKRSRFFMPIFDRVLQEAPAVERQPLQQRVNDAYLQWTTAGANVCR